MSSVLQHMRNSRGGRRWAQIGVALCLALGGWTSVSAQPEDLTGGDPMGSMQWPSLHKEFLGGQPFVFDARVAISGPRFAEDAQAVPIQMDGSALLKDKFEIRHMLVLVDRNPIRRVLDFEPVHVQPRLSFRFKLEQSSPVRVAVQDQNGLWHVNSVLVEATGGGCTVSGASRKDGSWSQTLNQVQSRFFQTIPGATGSRLRLRIMHPMDTGLVPGTPGLYLERLELRDSQGQLLWALHPFEPVAENPIFSFDFYALPAGWLELTGVDNNGNRLKEGLAP